MGFSFTDSLVTYTRVHTHKHIRQAHICVQYGSLHTQSSVCMYIMCLVYLVVVSCFLFFRRILNAIQEHISILFIVYSFDCC